MSMTIPDDMCARDYDAWFNRCYILLCGELVAYSFYEDGMVHGLPEDGLEMRGYPSEVEFEWPLCGCVNGPEYALYVERRQSRQWRRAFNMREVDISYPDSWEIMKAMQRPILKLSDFQIAKACHFPRYPSMDVACVMLDSGEVHSVAISPHVIIAGVGEERRVYLRNEMVGIILRSKLIPTGSVTKARRVLKTIGGRYAL